MTTIFVATSNKGKQAEIAKYADQYGKDIVLRFPDAMNSISVDETGTTFEENALLKAKAYQEVLQDKSIVFVGDDSGIKIPALNDEPGVFTRRWAGHEMTDAEILTYCMDKMKELTGERRAANFETVLAVVKGDDTPQYFTGIMSGHILDKPIEALPIDGFPFRSVFWVDEINRPIYEVHSLKPEDRGGFLTHREKAFKNLFESVAE
jgi:XTP/dITP diphosphohydrolase